MPVGGRNFFRLLQNGEAVLLFPGGVREVCALPDCLDLLLLQRYTTHPLLYYPFAALSSSRHGDVEGLNMLMFVTRTLFR